MAGVLWHTKSGLLHFMTHIMHDGIAMSTPRCASVYNVTMPKQPFITKVCPACNVDKPRSEYYKKGDTVSHKCKPCTLAQNKERQAQYFGKYTERELQWKRERYASDPEYREKIAAQKKAHYDAKNDKINERRRERWATDPLNPARKYYRRKDVKDKTPPWVDQSAILDIYSKCPDGHEIDHIVPLRGLIDGRPVSGLHVPWNLQYLTVEANRKKKNRLSESELSDLMRQWLLQSPIAHLLGPDAMRP